MNLRERIHKPSGDAEHADVRLCLPCPSPWYVSFVSHAPALGVACAPFVFLLHVCLPLPCFLLGRRNLPSHRIAPTAQTARLLTRRLDSTNSNPLGRLRHAGSRQGWLGLGGGNRPQDSTRPGPCNSKPAGSSTTSFLHCPMTDLGLQNWNHEIYIIKRRSFPHHDRTENTTPLTGGQPRQRLHYLLGERLGGRPRAQPLWTCMQGPLSDSKAVVSLPQHDPCN